MTVALLCNEVEMSLKPPLPGVLEAVWQSLQIDVGPTGMWPLAG
jgi:hypothetical protein